MSIISNFLFGKKVFIEDSVIGTLEARIKSKNPSIKYTWLSEHLIPNQKAKTVFILEGNINGPSKQQLGSAYRIVTELESITDEIDSQLSKKDLIYAKLSDWKKTFYFAALTSYEERANEYEINFEPIDEDDTRYIGCIWSNGRITEVEAK